MRSVYLLLLMLCSSLALSASNAHPPKPRPAALHVSFGPRANGAEGGANGSFNLKVRANSWLPITEPVLVKYYVTGTATEGADYDTLVHTVRIPGSWFGKGNVTIPIKVIDDGIYEDTEHIQIGILEARSVFHRRVDFDTSKITIDIADNDTNIPPDLKISVTTTDGTEGGSNGGITFSLQGNYVAPEDIVIAYNYTFPQSDNTAVPGGDFDLNLAVILPKGAHSVTAPVIIYDDTQIETTEEVSVDFLYIYGADIGLPWYLNATGAGVNIYDNDGRLIITSTNGREGGPDGSFIFRLPPGVTAPVNGISIRFEVWGSAVQYTDYMGLTTDFGEVILPEGASELVLPLQIVDDNEAEPTEDVVIHVYEVSTIGYYPVALPYTVINDVATIEDNDSAAIRQKMSGNELTVYPNPVVNNVIVTIPTIFTSGQAAVILSDINGRVIRRIVAKNSKEVLNVSDLPHGTYFITVTNGKKQFTKTIVK